MASPSTGSIRSNFGNHGRAGSWGQRLIQALADRQDSLNAPTTPGGGVEGKGSIFPDERVWYDQFTSTDWVHDSIADAYRMRELRSRKGFVGRCIVAFDASQGWILAALVGFVTAVLAYLVDVSEATVFDFKDGYCTTKWYHSEKTCCPHGPCTDWRSWSEVLNGYPFGEMWTEYTVYLCLVILLATISCLLALTTKTVVPSAYQLSPFDENLAAKVVAPRDDELRPGSGGDSPTGMPTENAERGRTRRTGHDHAAPDGPDAAGAVDRRPEPPMVYYPAAGSGVAEVRVIVSGFVLHGFLGVKTLLVKTVALVFSVSSGLSLGKEGPYVHIATCVGNIACRLFRKYDRNDAKRREILSAAAAAGIAVAFGAPLGGVLFCLEEVAYFFPAKTLFRTFFATITAALSLKFLNPYGTHKIVMFQVRYLVDWEFFELGSFILVGVMGGAAGALFIKASRLWAQSFRRIGVIKRFPLLEVVLVALFTGLVSYWNRFTRLPVSKLLLNLAAPCDADDYNRDEMGLCPTSIDDIPDMLLDLFIAFVIKGLLTTITFGIKVPAGIYIPSMVVGGLMGRLVGHMMQWIVLRFPKWTIWGTCPLVGEATCIQPGVYGLIAAGSTMCGVTRLSVTLAVILFELTGSLDYVLPFSLGILVAKWTADAIERNSIYDLLMSMNNYPFLNNKHKPIFTTELADLVPSQSRAVRRERVIDITNSPVVPAASLRMKLELLHKAGELDGGLPIIRDGILVGLIPAPDLEFALDSLHDEGSAMCLMAPVPSVDESDGGGPDPTDFTPYIDPVCLTSLLVVRNVLRLEC